MEKPVICPIIIRVKEIYKKILMENGESEEYCDSFLAMLENDEFGSPSRMAEELKKQVANGDSLQELYEAVEQMLRVQLKEIGKNYPDQYLN